MSNLRDAVAGAVPGRRGERRRRARIAARTFGLPGQIEDVTFAVPPLSIRAPAEGVAGGALAREQRGQQDQRAREGLRAVR